VDEATENRPTVVKAASFRGVVRPGVPPQRVLNLVRAFHEGRLPPGSQKLSDHDGKYESYFVPLPDPPGEVLLKHFSHQRLSRFVWPIVGISKAMHCWRIAERLMEPPPLTSPPVAAIERRKWGIVLDSYFLHEWIQPGICLIEAAVGRVLGGDQTKEELYQDMAEFMAQLHRRGIYHSGLHTGNILEASEGSRLLMIDLDTAAFRPNMPNRDRMRMLYDAFEYFLMICEPADFKTFVACYARTAHIPMAALRRLTASGIKRLRRKRDEMRRGNTTYCEEKLIRRLVRPTSRPTAIAAGYVPSWDGLLEKLTSLGFVCAACRNVRALEGSAPGEWLARLRAAAKEEEAEADRALGRFHAYTKALVDAGVRPLLLGTLPLLQHYGHPLGVGALTPFEVIVQPEQMGKAADLLKSAEGVDVLLADSVVIDAPSGQVRLSVELLMADTVEFDFCGLPLRTPRPERAFIHYAVRAVAPQPRLHLHTSMDFCVFLASCMAGVDLDATVALARELSAEALLWHAIRTTRIASPPSRPLLRDVARRLAS